MVAPSRGTSLPLPKEMHREKASVQANLTAASHVTIGPLRCINSPLMSAIRTGASLAERIVCT